MLKNGIDINDDELFWVNTLTNIEDYIKHYKIDLKDISCEKFSLSDELFQKINKFTEKYEISYFKFLISIFALYLSRVDRTGGCILKSRILDEISKSELGTLLKIDYNKKNSFIEHMDCVSDSYDIANVHTKTDVEDYVGNIVDLVHYSVNDISKVSEYVDKNSVLTFNVCLKNLEIRYNTSLFDEIYNIVKLAIIPTVAIAEANVPLSAYFYGSNNFDTIKDLIKFELKVAIGISVIIWFVLFILNGVLAGLYGTSLLFFNKFTSILPFYLIILIFMPFGNIGVSLLQSLQKYNISLILTFVKSILLELILAGVGYYVFSNVFGIYLGLIFGSILGCILVFIISFRIFNKLKNKRILTIF